MCLSKAQAFFYPLASRTVSLISSLWWSQVCGTARPVQPPVWRTETTMWVWGRQRRVHSWIKTFWSWSTQTDKPAEMARETEPPSFASAATQTKWFVYRHVKDTFDLCWCSFQPQWKWCSHVWYISDEKLSKVLSEINKNIF